MKIKVIFVAAAAAAVIVAVLLAVHQNRPGRIFDAEPVHEIAGTYAGPVRDGMEIDKFFVFEEKGRYCCYKPEETARIIDEGTYTPRDHNIFQLDSALGRTYTVVCAEAGLYVFDPDSGAVYYFHRVSEEIYYVNLPPEGTARRAGGQNRDGQGEAE